MSGLRPRSPSTIVEPGVAKGDAMSLSDRLQQARTERLIASGVLPAEHALKPEIDELGPAIEDDGEAEGLFAPITIEVMPAGLHLVAEAPRDLVELRDSETSARCPNCNSVGRLDMVDLVGHTQHLTCENCGTMWHVRQSVDETATG